MAAETSRVLVAQDLADSRSVHRSRERMFTKKEDVGQLHNCK